MLRIAVLAPLHNRMACRAWLVAPVVVVSVTSASVLNVVVPATALSSNDVIALLTVSPHVPESSPVTGSANPSNEVYAVAISFPYADLISALVAVFAGMLNVKVVLVLLSEPKSSTAMARSALLAL